MFGIDDAALAILAAGALGTAGSIYMNKRNTAMQNYWNGMSVDLANSAHQREVADLYLAGLNPILSAGGNGASTPQLTSPKVENAMGELAAAGSNSAKYFSDEYATNVAQQQLLNDTIAPESAVARSIVNDEYFLNSKIDAAKNAISAEWTNVKADMERAVANWKRSREERAAFDTLLNNPDDVKEFRENLKEGILAAAKDATNINWRHNVDAFSGAVNSAANVINAGANLKSGGKAGKWGQRFNRVRSLLPTGGY